ncbi:MAG: glycosyltransferase family 2 protein [Kiritimatiellia bacterium]
MKFSIVTPNFNGATHLEECLESVRAQACDGVEVEHIVMDGGSDDGSLDILARRRDSLAFVASEPDRGPADAINKGFARSTGDVLAWLNADDLYRPGALSRVAACFRRHPDLATCFGRCDIIDADGAPIRTAISRFKHAWYPFACRFTIQMLNYVSQPALFLRRETVEASGPLRLDLRAAWDYEFLLRAWRQGPVRALGGAPLSAFRWTPGSISGANYHRQFDEELAAAEADAGRFSPQALLHRCVRWGIVAVYDRMARTRAAQEKSSP